MCKSTGSIYTKKCKSPPDIFLGEILPESEILVQCPPYVRSDD